MLRLKTINDGDTDDDDNGEVYVICLMFLMIILLTRQKVCNMLLLNFVFLYPFIWKNA